MKTKRCSKCRKTKELSKFFKRARSNDGYSSICINCRDIKKKYYRTKKGLVSKIYCSQKDHSKRRRHQPPLYSRDELWGWINNENNIKKFNEIFEEWVKSGYAKDKILSIDRKDNSLPYSFDNIQLTTWDKNNNKSRISTKINRIPTNKTEETVVNLVGVDKETGKTISFVIALNLAINGSFPINNDNDITNNFYWEFKTSWQH